jgi:hypothetical protein
VLAAIVAPDCRHFCSGSARHNARIVGLARRAVKTQKQIGEHMGFLDRLVKITKKASVAITLHLLMSRRRQGSHQTKFVICTNAHVKSQTTAPCMLQTHSTLQIQIASIMYDLMTSRRRIASTPQEPPLSPQLDFLLLIVDSLFISTDESMKSSF